MRPILQPKSILRRRSRISKTGCRGRTQTFLVENSRPYCPPQTVVLTGEQLIDILRREIKDEPWESTRLSFPAVLITALEKVFPCPDKVTLISYVVSQTWSSRTIINPAFFAPVMSR